MARLSTPGRRDADRAWALMGGRPGAARGPDSKSLLDAHPHLPGAIAGAVMLLMILTFAGFGALLASEHSPASPPSASVRP